MDKDQPAVIVKDLYKTFKLPHEKHSGIKQAAVGMFRGKRGYEVQKVLNDISFEIKKGEFFGIVGRNGSGKSTLLKLLAGIYSPDKGLVQVNGSLTPFIELGVGFNPELTGRENVFMNGALLGFDHAQMAEMYDDIVDFAELPDFMDQKLKNYSSGMQVRLAFSIAIRAQSDILLLDEVLAVGDAIFQKKCYEYFKKLKKDKKTVIFVSHDVNALYEYCDRGILIEEGRIVCEGKINTVIDKYIDSLNTQESGEASQKTDQHVGAGGVRVTDAVLLNAAKKETSLFTEKDKDVYVKVKYEATESIQNPIFGISIYDAASQRIVVVNNLWSQIKMDDINSGQSVEITWAIPNVFASGTFTITPAVASDGGSVTRDQAVNMISFRVRKRQMSSAYTNIEYTMEAKYS